MRFAMRVLSVVLIAGFPMCAWANPVAIIADSYFDEDLGGWELHPGPGEQLSWEPDGTGHGGFARFEDAGETAEFVRAPEAFLGDWSELDGVGYIHWELRVFRVGDDPAMADCTAIIAGPGGRAVYSVPPPADPSDWEGVTAFIYRDEWTVEEGSWAALLEHVDTLLIRIEMVGDSGTGRETDIDDLDNVVLGVPYSLVPPTVLRPTTWGAIKALWPER